MLDAVRLAVSEAVSNVVVHSYRDAERHGEFTISIEWENDFLHVIVRDHGFGMQPRTDSPGAGLGLPLIASLADSFSVVVPPDGGTEVSMTFPLQALNAACAARPRAAPGRAARFARMPPGTHQEAQS